MEKNVTLEERIDRIVHADEIELAGEAYKGKYELNDGKSIKKFILRKLRGKIKNLDAGDNITISKQSVLKLASHLKDGEIYQKTIAYVPKIIENMALYFSNAFPEKFTPYRCLIQGC